MIYEKQTDLTPEDVINGIKPADPAVYEEAVRLWDSLAKPLRGLGVLEEDIAKIASVRGTTDVLLKNRTLFIICADNGVVKQGVSQSDESVTSAVAAALGRGTSTVNHMARRADCRVIPVDAGMKYPTPEGVIPAKIRPGTADFTEGPAMTQKECREAVMLGVSLVSREKEKGTDMLLLGEMGIGNTTSSAAVVSALLGLEPAAIAGRGAGLSDAGLKRKISAIEKALQINRPDPSDPMDILQKVGGLDLAALAGICLGGAFYGIPVILDGLIACAAALCAVRLCPDAGDALIASHVSAEPAAKALLKAIGLKACISAGLSLGEGTGAVLALPLLDVALELYRSGSRFADIGIDAYVPQNS